MRRRPLPIENKFVCGESSGRGFKRPPWAVFRLSKRWAFSPVSIYFVERSVSTRIPQETLLMESTRKTKTGSGQRCAA